MNDRPVIAFTVCDRPAYLAWVLESWREVRGIGDAHLIFRCEPGCDEAVALCRAVDFAETTVTVNPQRYGVLGNPWHALNDGFAVSDFVVLAEEDLIVSEDVLEYFAWCRARYADDPRVLAITTHQYLEQPGGLAGVMPQRFDQDPDPHFWVWGTWRNRWEVHPRHGTSRTGPADGTGTCSTAGSRQGNEADGPVPVPVAARRAPRRRALHPGPVRDHAVAVLRVQRAAAGVRGHAGSPIRLTARRPAWHPRIT